MCYARVQKEENRPEAAMRVIVLLGLLALAGCATTTRMNSVAVGMTKQEVITTLGTPDSTSANVGVEYLRYTFLKPFHGPQPYFVRLVGGKVDAYGMVGDFGTTEPSATININQRTVE
jgi:outer membrane protein assembly factor BamE (lipoprotein component of BamABCDE complex)